MTTATQQTPPQGGSAPPPAPDTAAPPAAAPIPGQASPEPLPPDVEISLDGDGGEAAAPPAAAPPAAAPPAAEGLKLKNGGRANNRIAALDQERNELARQLEAERAERARLLEGAMKLVEDKRRSDIAAMTHYEARWSEVEANARASLKVAVDAGDAGLQAEAMARLTEAQTNLAAIRNWKAANPQAMQPTPQRQAQPQQQPHVPQRQEPGAPPQVDPATADWVKKNSWFDPESDDFDQEMHFAAANYAAVLERRLIAAGRANEVATPGYFARVEQFIRSEFPDAFDGAAEPPAAAPQKNGGAPVAPTGRGPAPGQQPPKSQNTIRLTGAERALVKQMNSNGALPLKPNGQRMSDHEAEVYFAKQKAADIARRKES